MVTLSRRKFLKNTAACTLTGTAGLGSSVFTNFAAQAADTSGYKALVCLFFKGGLDCHDTVLPFDQASYDTYAAVRSPLLDSYPSRARDQLLALNPANAGDLGGRQFALPSQMSALHSLFEQGNAAIIGNVGPLIRPITRTDFENDILDLPKRLFSHNDQQSTWMALQPEGAQLGWGGLFTDAMLNANANGNEVFTAISTGGNDVFLTGDRTFQYQIDFGGAQTINELSDPDLLGEDASPLAQSLLRDHFRSSGLQRSHLIERDVVATHERAIDTNDQFNNAIDTSVRLQTSFPSTSAGRQLQTIAETINIRSSLDVRRQVFFAAVGGFDTHSRQANDLPNLQQEFSEAISAFFQATGEMGVENGVTLFTASDFGRTLSVNGDGTDHGWGAHHFVVGGAVNGNQIYGAMPDAGLGHELDSGQGRLIPSTSIEQYAATLGNWFGLDQAELASALPNLSNFSSSNLGFV